MNDTSYAIITDDIDRHHEAGSAVMLTSRPGEGKSKHLAEIIRRDTVTTADGEIPVGGGVELRLASKYGEAIDGLPTKGDMTVAGKTYQTAEYTIPSWALQLHEKAGDDGEKVVYLLLEEFNTAFPDTQAAFQDVMLTGTLPNGFPLPRRTRYLLTGNPKSEVTRVYDLSDAMTNRMAHIDYSPTLEDWCRILPSGFPGESVTEAMTYWRSMVAGYLRANPSRSYDNPRAVDRTSGPWASRRSWTRLADTLAVRGSTSEKSEVVARLTASIVGPHVAPEFAAWASNYRVPDFDTLAAAPESIAELDPPRAYAALEGSLATALHRVSDADGVVQPQGESSAMTSMVDILNAAAASTHADIAVGVLSRFYTPAVTAHGLGIINPSAPSSRPVASHLSSELFTPIMRRRAGMDEYLDGNPEY